MLPGLLNPDKLGERNIPQHILAQLYNECIYPAAMRAIHRGEAGHWLPTREAELKRARDKSGRLQNSGRLIPQAKVFQFGQEIVKNVEKHTWGSGVYFFHELRGTRGA